MRFVNMRLVDPSHKLPMPAPHNRLFFTAGEMVDMDTPFWRALEIDGSIEPVPAEPAAEALPASAATHVAEPAAEAAGAPAQATEHHHGHALPGVPTEITDFVAGEQ